MNQEPSTAQVLKSDDFVAFFNAVVDFCAFMESENAVEGRPFLKAVRGHLLSLYSQGTKLPMIDLQTSQEYEDRVDRSVFEGQRLRLAERLGEFRFYWHVFDPVNLEKTEACCGDLLDDLHDMYVDLKRSVHLFQLEKPDCEALALWKFKFDFDFHWGDHCIHALGAVHYFLQMDVE
jgi:hypothetical protein